MIIYKITNLVNGKFYVGQDVNDDENYYGSGVMILNAIKKYGKNNFKKETLERCSNINELDNREIFWIKELNATNRDIGYNICEGGHFYRTMRGKNHPMFGKHHSEETKKIIKEKRKLQKMSNEQKQKLREKWSGDENPGKNKTQETIEKLKKAAIKLNRKGENHPSYGKKHKEETKKHWSEIRKGKNFGITNPDATRYFIEDPDGKELVFETRKAVMKNLGCGLTIFVNKKWKGFKIIKKEKINR
jgi:group I intron endonuclease